MSQIEPIDIIAEAGVNHNGSLERAIEMVKVAVDAGATVIKFQTFVPEHAISRFAEMAQYQQRNIGEKQSQLDMVRELALDEAAHRALFDHCKAAGIEFMSAPFDLVSLGLLADTLKVRRLKLASSEVTNAPLLVAVGRTGLPVILSTGMSNLAEVRAALGALAWGMREPGSPDDAGRDFALACTEALSEGLLQDRVTLLHCTTQYPTPPDAVNLRAMQAITEEFGLPVGLSDHTTSTSIAAAAVALGATVIEKHFTLDRSLPGPDHVASLEPHELAEMVRNIRDVEAALGDGRKEVQAVEVENIPIARKSIVAATAITKGELFTEGNLTVKRPGGGISPYDYWSLLGQAAVKDFAEDEQISV